MVQKKAEHVMILEFSNDAFFILHGFYCFKHITEAELPLVSTVSIPAFANSKTKDVWGL